MLRTWYRTTAPDLRRLSGVGVWKCAPALAAVHASYRANVARLPRLRLAVVRCRVDEFLRSAVRPLRRLPIPGVGRPGAVHPAWALSTPGTRDVLHPRVLWNVRLVLRRQPLFGASVHDRNPLPCADDSRIGAAQSAGAPDGAPSPAQCHPRRKLPRCLAPRRHSRVHVPCADTALLGSADDGVRPHTTARRRDGRRVGRNNGRRSLDMESRNCGVARRTSIDRLKTQPSGRSNVQTMTSPPPSVPRNTRCGTQWCRSVATRAASM